MTSAKPSRSKSNYDKQVSARNNVGQLLNCMGDKQVHSKTSGTLISIEVG